MKPKPKTKLPTLTVTFNWSGEIPKKLQKHWAALMQPRTFKLKL